MDVFTAISLCSGYEGLGLGLKRAIPNLRTICYVENEAYAIANLVAKIKEKRLDDAPVWDDIRTFDPKPFAGMVDIIHSGYPCQPFSVAGKRKGEADERHLWPFIRNHIQQIRPLYVFLENVAGHLRLGFDRVVRDLDELGYTVEAGLFTASEVGASFTGERLFVMAEANSMWQSQSEGGESDKRQWTIDSSKTMAQAKSSRLPNGGKSRTQTASAGLAGGSGHIRGVAWQEQEQYDWEEPRTVESGMGRTVDGFRSRVDELRLMGNGVVPAQAELAFRTLMNIMTGREAE